MAMAMQTINASQDRSGVDDYNLSIELFRNILSTRLKGQRDMGAYIDRHLGTDYGPDKPLSEAAEAAGLPVSAFSWKSSVSFYADDYVSASFGYGAPHMNHYPMPDGRWLITTLSGGEMPTIIKAVMDGRLPELTVEAIVKAAEKAK